MYHVVHLQNKIRSDCKSRSTYRQFLLVNFAINLRSQAVVVNLEKCLSSESNFFSEYILFRIAPGKSLSRGNEISRRRYHSVTRGVKGFVRASRRARTNDTSAQRKPFIRDKRFLIANLFVRYFFL